MEPKSILCFGDSNTWGMAPDGSGRLPFETRWPNRLQQILNQRNPNHQQWVVFEQGLNSRTWVMDDPLGAVNYGGDYSCNGVLLIATEVNTVEGRGFRHCLYIGKEHRLSIRKDGIEGGKQSRLLAASFETPSKRLWCGLNPSRTD